MAVKKYSVWSAVIALCLSFLFFFCYQVALGFSFFLVYLCVHGQMWGVFCTPAMRDLLWINCRCKPLVVWSDKEVRLPPWYGWADSNGIFFLCPGEWINLVNTDANKKSMKIFIKLILVLDVCFLWKVSAANRTCQNWNFAWHKHLVPFGVQTLKFNFCCCDGIQNAVIVMFN